MSKKYFVFDWNRGDHFEEHAWRTNEKGVVREGADSTPTEAQVVYGRGGERKARVRHQDAAIGLDTQDVHMGGDPCVVEAEIPDGRGGVIQTVHRYSQSGRFVGSYEVQWDKTAQGQHTLARKRRIFT